MTRDRETADAELIYGTATRLWEEAQDDSGDHHAIEDVAIAHESGVELDEVRRWLDQADGVQLTVKRYGETRTVEGPIRP